MHDIRFTATKIAARLALVAAAVHRRRLPLAPFRHAPGDDGLTGPEVADRHWPVVEPGASWGEHREAFTLRTHFAVPADWEGDVGIEIGLGRSSSLEALSFLYGPEALAFIDGEAWHGIDVNHTVLPIDERWRDGAQHLLALGGWMGVRDERYEMGGAALVEIDRPTETFVDLARLALDSANVMEQRGTAARLLTALDEAFRLLALDPFPGEAFYRSIPAALDVLRAGIAAAGPAAQEQVLAVGHAHIDLAWLWPVAQSAKKGAHTFSTVLRLMEAFPELRFSQSQPQLYRAVGEAHPAILEQIRARVAEGRWEPFGGMWVESDCNLAGAESLARQFVLGRRYFREVFGIDGSPILWLPDVFGYAWQLPQLMKQAGLDYFVTAKMSWNQYNRIPYDRFWWQGLDGSRVMTSLITTAKPGWWGATYSADLTPSEIAATWKATQQPELHDEIMIPFGHGDGGGGPTARMVRDAAELAAFPGMPRVRTGTAIEHLRAVEAAAGTRLPIWAGELYLELHRGTYTSQARNKRANRKMEALLHDAEFLAAWASEQGCAAYPHDALRETWELLCLNQFHDIIPGSSIAEVYADSERDYARIAVLAGGVRDMALAALDLTAPDDADHIVYNPTSFPRSEVIGQGGAAIHVETVPAYGRLAWRSDARTAVAGSVRCAAAHDLAAPGTVADAAFVLEHDRLRAEFDAGGLLVRLLCKWSGREALAPGARANAWQLFEDRPLDWDAWDIDIFHDDKPPLAAVVEEIRVVEAGGLAGALEIRSTISSSAIVQRIRLRHGSDRLDFETIVDWRDRHRLLKVAFPVMVLSPVATFDIQWGNVERPTHANTSWDWARFESCAQKWIDVSEGDFGVSLLNDCKHGHDVHGNVMRLTALRGPTFPDPGADLGEHRFTYALLPHDGDWRGDTVREAYALNHPLILRRRIARDGACAPLRESLVGCDNPGVVIETVKGAEDGTGLVLRLYEYRRTRGKATVATLLPVSSAARCNLHEDREAELPVAGGCVSLDVRPYEIVTVRLDRPTASER